MSLPFGFYLEADFNGDTYLFLFLLLIGAVFIFLMNKPGRNNQTRLEAWLNWFFPMARTLTFFIILLLIFSPEVSLHRSYEVQKHLAFIIDQSRSMANAWEDDEDSVKELVVQAIEGLKDNHTVDIWSMDGQKLTSTEISYIDELSIFSWSPDLVNERDGGNLYSTVFLVSDGHLNGGRSPLDMAWSKSIDVNVLYPGDPKTNTSLKIVDLNYLLEGEGNTEYRIRAKLQQEGLHGRRASLQVFTENDQLLNEMMVTLNQSFQDLSLPIKVKPGDDLKVKVKLFLEGGNYLSERFMDLGSIKEKADVLIISERINALHKFLIQSFPDSSHNIHVINGTTDRDISLNEINFPENIDLLVLNDGGEFTHKQISGLKGNMENFSELPIIAFYEGREEMSADLNGDLGIRGYSVKNSSGSQTTYWDEHAMDHAFYLGLLGQGYDPDVLLEYAPIEGSNVHAITNGKKILSIGYGSDERLGFSLEDRPPRAVFQGNGYWKWFFHPHSKPSFELFWRYLITYLDEIASFSPLQVKLPLSNAATGTYLTGDIMIKDLENRNITAAELRVWQENESGEEIALNLTRREDGVYQVQVNTKQSGKQLIIAEAFRFGELWGRDTSRIHLMSYNSEDQSRGVDEVFLTRLASRSGGKVIHLGNQELPHFPVETIRRESSTHFRGVKAPAVFGVLILLLTLEWVWRRRSGLL